MDNRKTSSDNFIGPPPKRMKQTSLEVYVVKTNSRTDNRRDNHLETESETKMTDSEGSFNSKLTETMEINASGSADELAAQEESSDLQTLFDENRAKNEQSNQDTDSLQLPSTSSTCNSLREGETEPATNDPLSLGTHITELKSTPQCAEALPKLTYQINRTVHFKVTDCFATFPDPWPEIYNDKWDNDHVNMPCSPKNLYRTPGSDALQTRWSVITDALTARKIDSSLELQKAILSYNKRQSYWNFNGLHYLFDTEYSSSETRRFFDQTLPGIVQLALKLPKLVTQPIPLLKQNMNHTIFLSQMQIASLLANAFLCTFPKRNHAPRGSPYESYPYINFSGLFAYYRQKRSPAVIEKLKCLINYFQRVIAKDPCGTVSFTRQSITHFPSWRNSQEKLCKLHVASHGTIEDCKGMLQMDFANKYLGGGVLRMGAVQEEIRFATCPELIAGQLFTEYSLDHECLIIKGVEQYNQFKGYAKEFRWDGDFVDNTPRDEWGRRYTTVVAIDATRYSGKAAKREQYNPKHMLREVNKAYCGFCSNTSSANLEAVATGNWGCGAFGGDPRLKALLQIIAASKAGRDVVYLTFKDNKLCQDIFDMHTFLTARSLSIGDLWKLLEQYTTTNHQNVSLYDFLYEMLDVYNCETDSQE